MTDTELSFADFMAARAEHDYRQAVIDEATAQKSEKELASDLRKRHAALLVTHEFKAGDLVRFKPLCSYGNLTVAIFVRMLDLEGAHIPSCEVGVIDHDGDMKLAAMDVRRLEPWTDGTNE